MNTCFTAERTNIAKGAAILMLLFHHLFYGDYWSLCTPLHPIENIIVPEIVNYSKVCVAIFLILSGYGLTKSYEKSCGSVVKFSLSHLFKLMFQFWFIYLIFVPLSFVFGNRNPIEIYSTGFKGVIKLLIDFCGISNLIGTPTINTTWWYMGIMIPLYILFPILLRLIRTHPAELCLISLAIAIMPFFITSRLNHAVFYWIFPFVEGMLLAKYNIINHFMHKYVTKQRIMISIFALLTCILIRTRLSIAFDGFLGLSLILLSNEIGNMNSVIKKSLFTLGKYSANIFMMHTFIYGYFFKDMFYSLKYPFLIYTTILITCFIIAIAIEKLKKITKYNTLEAKVHKLINRR